MPQLRSLGTSGLSTPPLVLGGNVFGWTCHSPEAFALLDAWVEGGGVMIDTADVYSAWVPGHQGGESETMIGAWLRQSGKRDKVLIATKVGMLDGDGGTGLAPARIAAAVDASLQRLGTDHIDLYFAHRDDPDVDQAEVLGAFQRLIDAGKVRAIGASNYGADRLESALKIADAEGLTPFTVLQPELNLLKRDGFEGALQTLCIERGLGVVTYFALASGFLSGKYRTAADAEGKARGSRVADYLDGRGPAVLAAMDAVAADTGASLSQIALAWNAAQPGVTAPIASATNVAQLDELLAGLDLILTPDQLGALDAASR